MDFAARSFLFIGTPILLCLSRVSLIFLLGTLIVFNPFTIFLLIKALRYYATPRASRYLVLNIETNSEVSDETQIKGKKSHTSYHDDYYRIWLISTHLTYLTVFEYYLVSSLQISVSESSLLLVSYMILLITLIDLKYNQLHSKSFRDGILMICNLNHMLVLAQIAYLNLTFSCAPRIIQLFGTKILMPYDCSYLKDNLVARMSMFCGINSAQILFCHLVFLFTSPPPRKQIYMNAAIAQVS